MSQSILQGWGRAFWCPIPFLSLPKVTETGVQHKKDAAVNFVDCSSGPEGVPHQIVAQSWWQLTTGDRPLEHIGNPNVRGGKTALNEIVFPTSSGMEAWNRMKAFLGYLSLWTETWTHYVINSDRFVKEVSFPNISRNWHLQMQYDLLKAIQHININWCRNSDLNLSHQINAQMVNIPLFLKKNPIIPTTSTSYHYWVCTICWTLP